jgi:hypothetical protein
MWDYTYGRDARARLVFRPYRRPSRHHGRTTGTWSYRVTAMVDGEPRVVFSDNTGGTATRIPAGLFRQAEQDAMVVRRMWSGGHRFGS